MARQDINIGVEGNDGTGDSIRASFNKVNENFIELYAVFGVGGAINFTSLSDTPSTLIPQTIPIVNTAGTEIMLAEIDSTGDNAIQIQITDGVGGATGSIKFISTFQQVSDDVTPRLGGPLYGANSVIAGVDVSEDGLAYLNAVQGTSLTMDSVVITQGYADQRYLTTEIPITIDQEPTGAAHYTWKVFDYINDAGDFQSALRILSHLTETQEEIVTGHGLSSAWNGTGVRMNFLENVPTEFADYRTDTYYMRVLDAEHIWLYTETYKEYSYTTNAADALLYRMDLSGIPDIVSSDVHTMTLAAYDTDLTGNYLANQMVPRKDLVYRHGDTMTGPLFMPDHPGELAGVGAPNGEEDLQVATKLYVDRGASFTSPDTLYVSNKGDDTMAGVPIGKEGSSISMAYSTINNAAVRAEELIAASPLVAGANKQNLTYSASGSLPDTYVLDYRVLDGNENQAFNENVRQLLGLNKDFIAKETKAYCVANHPAYDLDIKDIEKFVDAITMDMTLGSTANFLSIQSAQVWYSDVEKRREAAFYQTELVATIEFARSLSRQVLLQDLLHQGKVEKILYGATTVLYLELPNTNYTEGQQIRLENIPSTTGMNQLNDGTYYIKPEDNYLRSFELYHDSTLQNPVDTTSVGSDYENLTSDDVYAGIVWQNEELQVLDDTISDADMATRSNDVDEKWSVIIDIIANGMDSTPEKISYGRPYQIFVKNGGAGFITQTNLGSIEAQAGKVIVGRRSGAIAQIIRFTNNVVSDPQTDPIDGSTEANPTLFDLTLQTPIHFEVGEPLILAPAVKEKNVTIRVEAGTYEEDFPIRVPQNTSIIGEDYKRVIVKPRKFKDSQNSRMTQSKWAGSYFYRNETFDGLTISQPGVVPFLDQQGVQQGSLGYHYLNDPSLPLSVGADIILAEKYPNAANILEVNADFIAAETSTQMVTANPTLPFDDDKLQTEIRRFVLAVSQDLSLQSIHETLEIQGYYFNGSNLTFASSAHTIQAFGLARVLMEQLLVGTTITPTNTTEIPIILRDADFVAIIGETGTDVLMTSFVDKVMYAFDAAYNPPKRNNELDVFMLGDATVIKEITVEEQGGFMCVFDPAGQIKTRTPQIENCHSVSQSIDSKTFAGTAYFDAYVGTIPIIITSTETDPDDLAPNQLDPSTHLPGSLTLNVTSPANQGLFLASPALPAPFFVEGRRYQVNAISDYDRALGTAIFYLDDTSNESHGYVATQFSDYVAGEQRQVFLQTAGDRTAVLDTVSMSNDLGYGVVATNGSIIQVNNSSAEYCHAGYFSHNGSDLRTQSSSNSYGDFGLVAEGADPNEIPDQVSLKYGMVLPTLADSTDPSYNLEGDSQIYIKTIARDPHPQSILTVNHGGTLNAAGDPIGRLNYKISSVELVSPGLFRCTIQGDDSSDFDFFENLQAPIADGTVLEYRDSKQFTFSDIRSQSKLNPRPSTAINFDESDTTTYRTMDFAFIDPYGNNLLSTESRITVESPYEHIELKIDHANTILGYGDTLSDERLAIELLSDNGVFGDASRVLGTIFAWQGRLHRITEYHPVFEIQTNTTGAIAIDTSLASSSGGAANNVKSFASATRYLYNVTGTFNVGDTVNGSMNVTQGLTATDWAIIKFEYVTASDILGDTNAGLRAPITTDTEVLYAGLEAGATGEITIAISLLRAMGHSFTEIGRGGINDTNFPQSLYGDSINPLADYYTTSDTATTGEVWEKRKGRCFWVSSDQYGFFRVGQYFNVDQGTGAISFSGNIGISNASSLGFVAGVSINEFSVDDSFTDLSSTAVPTEKAIASYISKVLGFDFATNLVNSVGRIGPGFLPLSGHLAGASMDGNIAMGGNKITDLDNPVNLNDAVNKAYVDDNFTLHNEIIKQRDFSVAHRNGEMGPNQVIISTGARILYTNTPVSGSFTNGMNIRNTADPALATIEGTVVHANPYVDEQFGNVVKVVYNPTVFLAGRSFDSNLDATLFGGTYVGGVAQTQATFISPVGDNSSVGGSHQEITNAQLDPTSTFSMTTSRGEDTAYFKLEYNPLSIDNSHISATAGIVQSKLLLNRAPTLPSTTVNPSQSDLGVAAFNEDEFVTDDGFIKLKTSTSATDGINLDKLQYITTGHVLGRTGADGPIIEVPFSSITGATGGIVREDFPTRYVSGEDVLIRTGGNAGDATADTFNTVALSTDKVGNSVVKRTSDGDIYGRRLILNDYLQFKDNLAVTRNIFSVQGVGEINLGDVIGSNGAVLSSGSATQQGSSYQTGFTASNWTYSKGIESFNNGGNGGSGVGLVFGAGTGFADSTNDNIVMFSGGSATFKFNSTSILPAGAGSRNIGATGSRIDTVYATVFDGTATKAMYADLAENYVADDKYDIGTVLVFGGNKEVTVTNAKGDRRVAGIVSANPAYLMNSSLDEENTVPLALQGRVMVKVIGKVEKGDLLVAAGIPGYAIVDNNPQVGTVLGKAVGSKTDDFKGVVEIVVGRV